jgi:hypothetical protein
MKISKDKKGSSSRVKRAIEVTIFFIDKYINIINAICVQSIARYSCTCNRSYGQQYGI